MNPHDPEGCAVWSQMLLVGSPMAESSQGRGQTNGDSKNVNVGGGWKVARFRDVWPLRV